MHKQSMTRNISFYGKEQRTLYSWKENGFVLTYYFIEGYRKIQGLQRGDKINSSLL